MAYCQQCKKVTNGNKKYCSNACKQRAYRNRRNVTDDPIVVEKNINLPSTFEYEIVLELIKQEHYSFLKPTFLEYAFVKRIHPEINRIQLLSKQLILIKQELNSPFSKSIYKDAFKNFVELKVFI